MDMVKNKIYGFYHAWILNGREDIAYNQLKKYKNSELSAVTTKLHIGLISDLESKNKLEAFISNLGIQNYEIYYYGNNPNLYEFPTLSLLKKISLMEDFYCYYFHTKGISLFIDSDKLRKITGNTLDEKNKNLSEIEREWLAKNSFYLNDEHHDNITQYERCVNILNAYDGWKDYLEFFVIERYDACLNFLNEYDAVGPHLMHENQINMHFRGNFWWSKSDYIRKLPDLDVFNLEERIWAEFWLICGWGNFKEPHTLIIDKPIFAKRINQDYRNENNWNK